MNQAGKIFIVINLILSVAFAMFSISLYAKRADYRKEANTTSALLSKTERELGEVQDRLKSLELEYTSESKKNAEATIELQSKTEQVRELERLREADKQDFTTKLAQAQASLDNAQALLADAEQSKTALQTQLSEANQARNTAQRELDFAEKRALEVAADLKEAEAQLQANAERTAEIVEQNLEMRTQLKAYETSVGPIKELATKSPLVPIRGKVIEVEESLNLVMLNVGKKDNVKTGMELVVSRGSEYVSKVKVKEIYADMCSAEIDTGMTEKPIRKGDVAETL
ncbi:MAG: hypothetical protein JXA52_01320 [Planctomycetes bacterium]|nr:hypothetical protein [Planctomycetota bacterium]